MKNIWTLLLLLGTLNLFAQLPDDCANIIDVGVAPACDQTIYNNVGATASDIGFGNEPICFNGGTTQRDVWFAFTTSDTIFDYTIAVTGIADGGMPSITNPQMAIYRGDCVQNGLAELFCVSAELGEQFIDIDIPGLTPNVTYFIRINDYSSSATAESGAFQLCIDEVAPSNNVDDGNSTACSGVLFDSGGEDGDYVENEDHTFTICPSEFHNCITFDVAFYNTEFNFDFIRFYDGEDITGDFLGALTGGGVDYQVQASSGCLTVEFISDGLNNFEGFEGSWTCSTAECTPSESVLVSPNPSEQEIIENLTTPQTTISNIVLNCGDGASGIFQANEFVDLNMEKGIILTTGLATLAEGPNQAEDASFEHAPFGLGIFGGDDFGDEDLNTLSPDDPSADACVLEFDVFVATNELRFDYVFGSEEYPEFAPPNFPYNDIFAFLVSGPGITGDPGLNGQKNIAVLPDGTPVSINTINTITNWEYYKDNQVSNSIEYDGLIVDQFGENGKMVARTNVEPCNTYHLKLAIADRGDETFDSGVFVSELKGSTPNLSVNFSSGIDYLLENCTNTADELVISLTNPQEDTTSYIVNIGGTATPGIDYILDVPMVVTLLPGETSLSFPLSVLSDLEAEMTETIEISLSSDFGCGIINLSTISIDIRDELDIQIETGTDTVFVCSDSSIILNVSGAANYFWTPVNIVSDPTSPSTTVMPSMSQYVYVEGTVGANCADYDSVFVQITEPELTIQALSPTQICEGEQVTLQANNNVNNTNLMWTPALYLDDPSSALTISTPDESIKYIATVALGACLASDTINVIVDNFDFPDLTTTDTTVCQSYPVQLAETIDSTNTIYTWTPADGLDDASISGPIATPTESTVYTLNAISASGNCTAEATVNLQIIEALLDIEGPDTLEICLGESIDITANTSTNGVGLTWSPADHLSSTTTTTVTADPTVSTWYYTTLTANECTVFDSVYVRVDSLPDDAITAIPNMDIYCQGDIVTLVSENIDADSYPDIEYLWSPPIGELSELTNWNLAITATETTTYTRMITNGACESSASIDIAVQPVIELIATPDATLCSGETLQLEVFSDNADDFEWSPEGQGLSCTECENPLLTVQNNTAVYTVTATAMGCVMTDNITVTVASAPAYLFPTDPVICLGNSITLNLNPNPVTTTYTWTSPDDATFNSTEAAPTVMPTTTTTYQMVATTDCTTIEDDITIVVIEDATMTVSNDTTVCENTSVTLFAEGTAPGDYTWTWDNNTSDEQNITVTQAAGTVEYTVSYTYGNGCGTLTESIFVTANPFIVLDESAIDLPEDVMICDGEVLSLTAEGNAEGTYTWTWGENETANGATITPEHANGDTLTYYVSFMDEEACLISNDSVEVISYPIPDLNLTADIMTVIEGAPVTLYANSTFENLTYQWSEGTSILDSTSVFPIDNPTDYAVTITTEDACSNTATISINTTPPQTDIPNLFTPNNDEANDFFNLVSTAPFEVIEFRVYNRWGQIVYNNETPNTGWDGTFNEKLSPSDVYIYYVVYSINGLEQEPLKGDVTLVR